MRYRRDDGEEFSSYEEAHDDAMENLEPDEFAEFFFEQADAYKVLAWAMKQSNFFDYFEDEISRAESEYFEDHYYEMEDDEDEEF